MRVIILILLVFMLAGCAGSIVHYKLMSEEKLLALPTAELCYAYHHTRKDKIRPELERRGVIPENEWELIEKNKIAVGMTAFGMFCSWGAPSPIEGTANVTTTAEGTRVQWVYREYLKKTSYVYTWRPAGMPPDSAKITAIQQ